MPLEGACLCMACMQFTFTTSLDLTELMLPCLELLQLYQGPAKQAMSVQ